MEPPESASRRELEVERVLREAGEAQVQLETTLEAAAAEPVRRKRVDVIRDLAVSLFNQEGVAAISTNRIASELGISPGNLYYHYKTKSAVLEAAFEIMERDLIEALANPSAILAVTEFVDWMIQFQRTLWRHRYFFASLEVVIKTAPMLRIPWLKLQTTLTFQLASIHEYYVQRQIMTGPKPPNTVAQVAQNGLMLWMSWIRWEFMNSGGSPLSPTGENEVIRRLVGHHLSFYEPYHGRTRQVSEALVRVLDERLLAAANSRRPESSPIR